MFSSKYVFETQQTRYFRYIKNFTFIFSLSWVLYSFSCLLFIVVSERESQASSATFFKKPPDVIVIFTGDRGRIEKGFKLAKKYNQNKIFITGVYSKNSVTTLINKNKLDSNLNLNLIEIDYLARNTVENALSTLRYLRKKESLKKVLFVSHDYHIMRIKLIMAQILNKDDKFYFNFHGIETDYYKWRNIKILYKEVFKLIRTYGFLLLWDRDISLHD
jgi:uncharacterized SAM-binding protein YcdF (DUF218 family)